MSGAVVPCAYLIDIESIMNHEVGLIRGPSASAGRPQAKKHAAPGLPMWSPTIVLPWARWSLTSLFGWEASPPLCGRMFVFG